MMNQKHLSIVKKTAKSIAEDNASDDLYDLLERLDALHTHASEGTASDYSQLSKCELTALLQEVIYTAQETLSELSETQSDGRPALRIVDKVDKISEQAG